MTNQEIFDKVWNWFIRDNNPPSIQEDICLYRGPNGAKCAAGILIPDSEYLEGMERRMVEAVPFFINNFPDQLNLITALQRAHDDSAMYGDTEFRIELESVAERFRLTIPS